MTQGWIGVDLDGTLAKYDGWRGELHIGEPVPMMLERVKGWILQGKAIKIVTARVSVGTGDRSSSTVDQIRTAIQDWCEEHLAVRLEVVCCKDFGMIELWDDRCVQVVPNTGMTIEESLNAEKWPVAMTGQGS